MQPATGDGIPGAVVVVGAGAVVVVGAVVGMGGSDTGVLVGADVAVVDGTKLDPVGPGKGVDVVVVTAMDDVVAEGVGVVAVVVGASVLDDPVVDGAVVVGPVVTGTDVVVVGCVVVVVAFLRLVTTHETESLASRLIVNPVGVASTPTPQLTSSNVQPAGGVSTSVTRPGSSPSNT